MSCYFLIVNTDAKIRHGLLLLTSVYFDPPMWAGKFVVAETAA